MKIRRDEGMLNVFTGVSNIFHNGIIREGRSSSSLSIFLSEGQNLNFSSFSLTRSKSRFGSGTKCSCGRLIILIILPAIVCTHFTLQKKRINKGLQSLRQTKKE